MKKRMIALLLALVLVLGLAACSGTSADTTQDPTDATTPTANDTSSDTTAAADNTAAAGKTLSIALSENLVTLDPHDANNAPGYQPRNMCFDALVESDHAGNYTPGLAESWSFSDDGTQITFVLRKDVKWQDGTDFTAADVVCTFQRLIDNRELNISSIYWSLLESVESSDDYTVTITLSQPYAAVMNSLSVTAIIQKAQWEAEGEAAFNDQNFIGTGPWVFDEWIDGQYVHVTKNENYWGDFDSYYDDVYLRFVLEASTAVAAHRNGDVQAYIASSGIASDNIGLYDGSEDQIELVNINTGTVQYFGFQCGENSVFRDKNVRLAFAHAIDRQSIADYVFGGQASVTDSFAVETVIGYSDKTAHYDYDPDTAKAYLADSIYNGEPIVLVSNTGTKKSQESLLAVSDMLQEVGFNSSVEIVETATLSDLRATGDYDVFLVATMQENGEPYKYFNMRVLNDAHHSFFVDEALNEKIIESNSEMDPDARRALLEECVVMWSEDLVHLPLVRLASTYAITYGVEGIELYQDGLFNFKYVTHE